MGNLKTHPIVDNKLADIRENWVPLDMLDLLKQMDVDVLDRMRSHFQRAAWAG